MVVNHILICRNLQCVGFSATKLMLKSINIVKPSDNNYVVCSLVRWNQNILPVKVLGGEDMGVKG